MNKFFVIDIPTPVLTTLSVVYGVSKILQLVGYLTIIYLWCYLIPGSYIRDKAPKISRFSTILFSIVYGLYVLSLIKPEDPQPAYKILTTITNWSYYCFYLLLGVMYLWIGLLLHGRLLSRGWTREMNPCRLILQRIRVGVLIFACAITFIGQGVMRLLYHLDKVTDRIMYIYLLSTAYLPVLLVLAFHRVFSYPDGQSSSPRRLYERLTSGESRANVRVDGIEEKTQGGLSSLFVFDGIQVSFTHTKEPQGGWMLIDC